MTPPHPPTFASPRTVVCDVAAYAWVRAPLESLPELRRNPGPGFDAPLPVGALKQADEQTVAAVAAVAHAAHSYGLAPVSFRSWAVLAAPYYMGRPAMAAAVGRYLTEGAWGASPHLPPHRSLHSPSGTISQLFKMHGPNYGVGGGPGCAAEILTAAAAVIDDGRVPGVWATLTALDPDLPPDRAGAAAPGTACAALALALIPVQSALGSRVRLSIAGPAVPLPPATSDSAPALDLFTLKDALDALFRSPDSDRSAFVLPLEAGGRLEIARTDCSAPDGRSPARAASLLAPIPLAEAEW